MATEELFALYFNEFASSVTNVPMCYRLRPFYSVDDFEKRLEDFRKEKGRSVISKILKLARELNEPWDLSVIQELVDLKVTKLATHNPLRSVVEVGRVLASKK